MSEVKQAFQKGLNIGTYYAGVIAPIAVVVVVASWFKSSNK